MTRDQPKDLIQRLEQILNRPGINLRSSEIEVIEDAKREILHARKLKNRILDELSRLDEELGLS